MSRAEDVTDYDEYDSVLVRAATKEEAIEIAVECCGGYMGEQSVSVEPVEQDGIPGTVTSSFNAG